MPMALWAAEGRGSGCRAWPHRRSTTDAWCLHAVKALVYTEHVTTGATLTDSHCSCATASGTCVRTVALRCRCIGGLNTPSCCHVQPVAGCNPPEELGLHSFPRLRGLYRYTQPYTVPFAFKVLYTYQCTLSIWIGAAPHTTCGTPAVPAARLFVCACRPPEVASRHGACHRWS